MMALQGCEFHVARNRGHGRGRNLGETRAGFAGSWEQAIGKTLARSQHEYRRGRGRFQVGGGFRTSRRILGGRHTRQVSRTGTYVKRSRGTFKSHLHEVPADQPGGATLGANLAPRRAELDRGSLEKSHT